MDSVQGNAVPPRWQYGLSSQTLCLDGSKKPGSLFDGQLLCHLSCLLSLYYSLLAATVYVVMV